MVAEGGEGENPLLFSLTAPKRGGGYPGRSPPPPFQPTPTPSPGNLRGLGGFCGEKPKPPGDLAHRPLGPGSRRVDFLQACYQNPQSAYTPKPPGPQQGSGAWIPPLSPVDFLQACYHNPQSACGALDGF